MKNKKEKFQAVFTWRMKKPTFEFKENTTPKEELNYKIPNYFLQNIE